MTKTGNDDDNIHMAVVLMMVVVKGMTTMFRKREMTRRRGRWLRG